MAGAARHRVVIVGGGFDGVAAAKALRRAAVDIAASLNRTNHHLFQPLLYQVATGILSEGEIAPALRSMFRRERNVRVLLAEVTSLDVGSRTLRTRAPDGEDLTIPYDSLIVAAGATDAYFGHDEGPRPGDEETLEDARGLRSRILGAFEMAEAAPGDGRPDRRRRGPDLRVFGISHELQVWLWRIAAIVIPILGFLIARAICRRLLKSDAHPLREWTGTPVARSAEGGFEAAGRGGRTGPPG